MQTKMDLTQIKELYESSDLDDINQKIKGEWYLLDSYLPKGFDGNTVYVLGRI